MSIEHPRRGRRGGEQGLTLIELMVAIAIMTVGFLALISAFSTIERQVGTTADDAQLVTLARQVTDVIKTQPSQGGLAYVPCASSASAYQAPVIAAVPAADRGTDTITVTTVAQAQSSSSHVVSSVTLPLTPISGCGGASADYGVQQITFRITSPQGISLVRVVYKRWD